jgi:hypothetical protein
MFSSTQVVEKKETGYKIDRPVSHFSSLSALPEPPGTATNPDTQIKASFELTNL